MAFAKEQHEVTGTVAPPFDPVRVAFERNLALVGSRGAAFAAYVDGVEVVDLRAGFAAPGEPWNARTLGLTHSANKVAYSLAVLLLADRGQLDLDDAVAAYWPEFAQQGKAAITVRQLLSHTAGLPVIPGFKDILKADGTGWERSELIASRLAAAKPEWRPGSVSGYHAFTYYYLCDELVRRVAGTTAADLFASDIATPLGLEFYNGIPASEQHRVTIEQNKPALKPHVSKGALPALKLLGKLATDSTLRGALLVGLGSKMVDGQFPIFANRNPIGLALPVTGATTAASFARLYAMLAGGGQLDGVRILDAATLDDASRNQISGIDRVLSVPLRWASGFVNQDASAPGLPLFGPSRRSYGVPGSGGQVGFADPERGLAVGFLRAHDEREPHVGSRLAALLVDALYESLLESPSKSEAHA
jgi:CubicO group peptidase (beta-lactamase class C family)